MAKTMVRTDSNKTELWIRCADLQETPTAPDSIWEWRSLDQPGLFEDDVTVDLLHDPASSSYSDPGRRLTDGTGGTDDELGAGMASWVQKLIDEANTRENVDASTRIPSIDFRLYIEWVTNTTYKVTLRAFSYGLKRNDPEDGKCYENNATPTIDISAGYELTAGDLGSEATVGDVAWFIKTKVLDPIKTAESIA